MRMILATAALAAAGFLADAAAADEQRVRCASANYAYRVCPIDRDAVEVELARQTSGAECRHEVSWGVRAGQIWVDRGCAAEFIVYTRRGRDGRDGDRVTCRSSNYRYQSCRIDDRAREVELVRRFSDAPCVYGQSWGIEPGRIWVDRGCAAEFEISMRDSDRGGSRRKHGDWRSDDRSDGRSDGRDRLDRHYSERRAVRACRRHGEDRPELLGANWAEANSADSFRAEKDRGDTFTVTGRFKTWDRGRDGAVRARCRVEHGRVVAFRSY